MESDLHHQQQQPQVNSSGLTRFKSAPSSYFNNIIDREFYEHVFNKPSSPETERVFSRFINSFGSEDDLLAQKISVDSTVKEEEEVNINHQQQQQDQGLASINNEHVLHHQQSNNYNNSVPSSHGFYQSSMMPPLPNQNVSSGLDGNFSMGVNRLQQVKNHGGNNSNLIRHSSSPAGLFSQINIENGMLHIFYVLYFCTQFWSLYFNLNESEILVSFYKCFQIFILYDVLYLLMMCNYI